MSTVDVNELILYINRHAKDVLSDVAGLTYTDFEIDYKTQRAVYMSLHQIGELAGRLPLLFRQKHTQMKWAGMRQVRNMIAHEYIKLNLEIIWDAIKNNIPDLIKYSDALLTQFSQNHEPSIYKKD